MSSLFKIIIGIAILLVFVLVGTFISDKYSGNNQKPGANPLGFLPYNPPINDEKTVKRLAENFLSGYGSYQKGNFSHLKEVKKMMTKKYQEETARFIEEKEQSNAGTKEYISYTSIPIEIILVSLDAENAKILINFEYNIFYGASLYLNGNLATIDQDGNKTTQPLKREIIKKQATILMAKEDGLWKVASIKIN